MIKFDNMENISYISNKKSMFTLYHIPDRKEWGCTKNLKQRLKKLGYTSNDVYETLTVDNVNTAAELEKELNIMYGYGWNESQDYRRVTKMGLNGAKKGGDVNKQTGWIIEAQRRSVIARTGTFHTEETKQKIREKAKGRPSGHRKSVQVFDAFTLKLIGEYSSQEKACVALGVTMSQIIYHLRVKNKLVGKYIIKRK